MGIHVILTEDWLNQTLYEAEKIIKDISDNFKGFPEKSDREKFLIVRAPADQAIFIVVDHNTLTYTRRLRCTLALGKELRSCVLTRNMTYSGFSLGSKTSMDDFITMSGEAINNAYMTVVESIVKESK